jgi:hypothetical protein
MSKSSLPLQTPKETGVRLGVSEVTAIRLYDLGELEGIIVRRGNRKRTIRFSEEAIKKFIAAKAAEGR